MKLFTRQDGDRHNLIIQDGDLRCTLALPPFPMVPDEIYTTLREIAEAAREWCERNRAPQKS